MKMFLLAMFELLSYTQECVELIFIRRLRDAFPFQESREMSEKMHNGINSHF